MNTHASSFERSSTAFDSSLTAGDAPVSGVSWPAITAGALGAAALSLILIILGVGLGLSSVSPWANSGASAKSMGISTVVWITITQLLASALGGYLAGRLRTKWTRVHDDEVYFRDTAHGFLAWAVATLVTAAFLTSSVTSILGVGAQAGGALVSSVASGATTAATAAGAGAAANATKSSPGQTQESGNPLDPTQYFVDALFRSDQPSNDAGAAESRSEAGRIIANSVRNGQLSEEDRKYLTQVVSRRAGISPADADKRVQDLMQRARTTAEQAQVRAREAADATRKASAYSALWMFVSLLIGAFAASVAATFGGRQRDHLA